jgi:hypothetical protein
MANVVQKFDADGKSVERELEKMRKEYDKLLQKMGQLEKDSEKAARSQKSHFEGVATSLMGAVTGYITLQQALEEVNAELQRQIDLQRRAAQANVTVASSQASVRKNIGDVTTAQFQTFLQGVQAIQRETGFANLAQLNTAAADVLSATGSNQATTLEVLKATAPIFRDKPEELAQFAGGVADVMSASGSSAEEATALALAGFGQSRTTSLTAFKNVAQAIKSGGAFSGVGDKQTSEEIIALFGTMSRFSGDVEGGSTRTAVVKFMEKMEAFGGEGSLLDRLGRVQEGIAGGTIDETKVLEGFEAASKGAVRNILRADPTIDADLRATVDTTKASTEAYARLVNDLQIGTPQLAMAASQQGFEGLLQQSMLTQGGVELGIRDSLTSLNEQLDANLTGYNFKGFSKFFETMSDASLTTPQLLDSTEQGIFNRLSALPSEGATPGQQRDRELLQGSLTELQRLRALMERNQRNPAAQAAVHDER